MIAFIVISMLVLAVLSAAAMVLANALRALDASREECAYSLTEKLAPCTKEDYRDASIIE